MILKTYTKNNVLPENLHREILATNSVQDFTGVNINGDQVQVLGLTIMNEAALDAAVANHTGVDLLKQEIELYINKRMQDGLKAFVSLMAELRLYSMANSLPRDVNKYIEEKLRKVRNEVILGQWVSGKEMLDEVVVEGYLTQELWDRVNTVITDYIAANY